MPQNSNLRISKNFIINSKSDLSCYFHGHRLHLLKNKKILGFISNDSWLHMRYGKNIRLLFLDNTSVLEIIKPTYNIFKDADTPTAILLLQKQQTEDHTVLFKTVNKEGFESGKFTIIAKPQKEILTDNWNNYFSNTEFIPKIKMVNMFDVGIIKGGQKTGCNDFFVLTKDMIKKYEIAEEYRKSIISNDIHEGLLTDYVVSEYLLDVNDSKGELVRSKNGKKVLKYIEYGEETEIIPQKGKNVKPCLISELSSVTNRNMWYSLGLQNPPSIFLSQIIDKRLKVYENNDEFYSLDVFAYFTPNNKNHIHAFLAYLASSWFLLYMEQNGHSMGGGALKFQIYDYKNSPVPDFNEMGEKNIHRMEMAWLFYRENFNRKKLDNIVFPILGFNENEKNIILDKLESKTNSRKNRKN